MDQVAHRMDALADALRPLSERSGVDYATGLWGNARGALIYAQGGLAATIIDRPADDATARGWTCEGDDDGLMADEWSRLNTAPVFADALRSAGRDGAAAILPLCQDGPSLAEPLNEGNLGTITALRPIAGAQLSPGPYRYADPAHLRYGEPTTYSVSDPNISGAYQVHETRLLRVHGEPMAAAGSRSTLPWAGRVRLSGRVAEDLERYRSALKWLIALLQRKQQPVHAAAGLAEMLAQPATDDFDPYAVVRARARSVDMTRGILGTVMVDGEDSFTVLDASLAGTGEITHIFERALCGSARMPFVILFGESPKGLGATGDGDFEGYYGYVGQVQNRQVRPGVERLTSLLWLQDAFRDREPKRWRIVFNPLWLPTETEQAVASRTRAEARKAEAEGLQVLADLGVASPDELRAAVRAVMPEYGLSDAPPPATGDAAAAL